MTRANKSNSPQKRCYSCNLGDSGSVWAQRPSSKSKDMVTPGERVSVGSVRGQPGVGMYWRGLNVSKTVDMRLKLPAENTMWIITDWNSKISKNLLNVSILEGKVGEIKEESTLLTIKVTNVKGIVHQNVWILSSFTHPHVIKVSGVQCCFRHQLL